MMKWHLPLNGVSYNVCSQLGLKASLESGLYPDFLGREGLVEDHGPDCNSALD